MIDLKVTLGTVNYTDFLHVTVAKVSAPGTIVYETWIDVPVTNYNFIIPGLDPENYLINYYDAATNVALGTLVSQFIVNALSPEFAYEKKFYKVDRGNIGDPVDGSFTIVDPYLSGKIIQGLFKEGFRYLDPLNEYSVTTTTDINDTINNLTGVAFSTDEVIVVEIKLAVGTIASTNNGSFYTGRVDVGASTYSCLLGDKRKRHRLVGTISTQVITLPAVASFAQDDFYLFDNSCGGTAKQVKILTNGSDRILFNGFNAASNLLSEIWVGVGEKLMIARIGANWEIVLDYAGVSVGESFASDILTHPNTLVEDGQVGNNALDGDEFGRIWWWIVNKLPSSQKIIDDNVINVGYIHPGNRQGQFVVHSTLKKFRTPNKQGMVEKGLKDFDAPGTDADRPIDYPGGWQDSRNKRHGHRVKDGSGGSSTNPLAPAAGFSGMDNAAGFIGSSTATSVWIEESGGDDVWVQNLGVIRLRKI
jgi:hypothetical protein